jgi:isopentenyl diphosphate isomerase/L-lactate dehydrogenase-like FMN-dependent dehydrogenase
MATRDPIWFERRRLLRYLAALPLTGVSAAAIAKALSSTAPAPVALADVLNVMEFEALARAALPPAHFGYLATGVDDDRTVALNHEAFSRVEIRSRRLVDVSHLDLSVKILGTTWPSPVYLSAVSSQRAFHPEAEIATARAAASRGALMMLSMAGSTSVENVAAARRAPVWMQLYATDEWAVTTALVKRAESAGCPAIALTVDNIPGRNNETLQRAMRADTRTCTNCHVNNSHDFWLKAPMFAGLDVSKVTGHTPRNLSWEYVDRLRQVVTGKLILKGIVTGEDAERCLSHGVDAIVISNHGGRDEETLRSTLECLPEVVAAVRGRIPVLIDGGVRRGTDVFKALALGATAVGIGRPQVWGLAAFGQPGVEAVLDMFTRELKVIMGQAGTPTIADISRERVVAKL